MPRICPILNIGRTDQSVVCQGRGCQFFELEEKLFQFLEMMERFEEYKRMTYVRERSGEEKVSEDSR